MIELAINTDEIRRKAQEIGKAWGLIFSDQTMMFRGFDVRLSEHIKGNFEKEGPGWAPLAESTREARERALRLKTDRTKVWSRSTRFYRQASYYRRTRPTKGVSPGAPIGVWTGKIRKRAQAKGKANRSAYTRTFGPRGEIRDRLAWLHQGGPNRAPRPIYRHRRVERLFVKYAKWWFETLTGRIDMVLDRSPGLQSVINEKASLAAVVTKGGGAA